MIAQARLAGSNRHFDLARGVSLGIRLEPGGPGPRFFTETPAVDEPLVIGNFRGQVDTGGSCNARVIRFAPHCHGTHTEGCGHLSEDRRPVQDALPPGLLPARLVSVSPVSAEQTDEQYPGLSGDKACLIPATGLALDPEAGYRALVIRCLPNDEAKCRRNYLSEPDYPVLTIEAARAVVAAGIEHLLIDTPSVDLADDGGRLAVHRIFWGMDDNGREPSPERARCTITEMIFAPDELADGSGLLSLGVSAIVGDASPSNPVFFPES